MEASALRSGKPPLLSRDFFEFSLKASFHDNTKSKVDLGVTYRPLDETIRDAVSWFRERGMVR